MRIHLFYFLVLTSLFLYPQTGNYQVDIIPEELKKNANAVVRLDEMKINLSSTNKMSYVVKQIVTVLNKEGNSFAINRIAYDNEVKIKTLDVYIYNSTGKELDHIKKKDFQDVSATDGFSLYTDDRYLIHKYIPTSYPYTISLSYEIETSDTGFFHLGIFYPVMK